MENIPVTGRFRFKSLINILEEQTRELRNSIAAGAKGGPPGTLCADLKVSLKGLVGILQKC